MRFQECNKNELEELKGKYNLNYNIIINDNLKKIYNSNNELVAVIDFIEEEDNFFIAHFEVINKHSGIGSAIIRELLKNNYFFELTSLETAVEFWRKMGFEIERNGGEIYCYYDNRA